MEQKRSTKKQKRRQKAIVCAAVSLLTVSSATTIKSEATESGATLSSYLATSAHLDPAQKRILHSIAIQEGDKPFTADGAYSPANTAFTGAADRTLLVGSTFDPKAGVKAVDKENGDLTDRIQVIGFVETAKPGTYSLVYLVKDFENRSTYVKRTITVVKTLAEVTSAAVQTAPTTPTSHPIRPAGAVQTVAIPTIPASSVVAAPASSAVNAVSAVNSALPAAPTGPAVPKAQSPVANATENAKPTISGATDKTLWIGETFDPKAGVTAADTEDGDLTAGLKIQVWRYLSEKESESNQTPVLESVESVDTKLAGKYEISYRITDQAGNEAEVRRVVTVKAKEAGEKPTIQGVEDKSVAKGETFAVRKGVTAQDKEDGDLTSKLNVQVFDIRDGRRITVQFTEEQVGKEELDTSRVREFEIVYEITDSDGNKTTAKRVVKVGSGVNNKPEIKGVKDTTLRINDSFDPKKGITATDKEDGDLTKEIEVTIHELTTKTEGSGSSKKEVKQWTKVSKVDTSEAGTYRITYLVEDSDGAVVEVTRNVTVSKTTSGSKTTSTTGNKTGTNTTSTSNKKLPKTGSAQAKLPAVGGLMSLLGAWVLLFAKREEQER